MNSKRKKYAIYETNFCTHFYVLTSDSDGKFLLGFQKEKIKYH